MSVVKRRVARLGALVIWLFPVCINLSASKPEDGLIKHVVQISYKQCIEECDHNLGCVSAKYLRMATLCKLYSRNHDGLLGPGVYSYTKPSDGLIELPGQSINKDCSSCGEPRHISGADILGNMRAIGSKIKYKCFDGTNFALSECLQNGSWSNFNMTCKCSDPIDQEYLAQNNVDSWSYQNNNTMLIAVPNCVENTCSQSQQPALCDIQSGNWTIPKTICCVNDSSCK